MKAPPLYVTPEQRHASEAVFMNLRKMKNPYELCRLILEKSNVDFVLFQTADILKNALITEWNYIPTDDRSALRQYLLNYIIQKELPSFVREKIMQVIAIMIKRVSIEDCGMERGTIIEEVQKMMISGDLQHQILSSTIIYAILQEYVITVKSDDTGLTFEDHFKAKKLFELNDLRRIFDITFQTLEQHAKVFDPTNSAHVSLMKQYLAIIETVMTWGFVSPRLPKKLIGAFESMYKIEQEACLRLSRVWETNILDPKVLDVFFGLYWKVRDVPEVHPKCLLILVQLSTLCGPIVGLAEAKLKYAHNYISHFLNLLHNIEIKDSEALGISTIFRKLLFYNNPEEIKDLPADIMNSLLHHMLLATCRFCEMSVKEKELNPEESIYMDAFSNILEAWVTVMQGKEYFSQEHFKTSVAQMFDKYLQCHLSPPEGILGTFRNDIDDEVDEDEAGDRIRFKEQLIIVGMFGREVVAHSLPIMSKLLEEKVRRLYGQLQLLFQEYRTTRKNSPADLRVLENLYEDIHWTVLIAGHVLANDLDGEHSLVPPEIMRFCVEQVKNGAFNITSSLELLATPSKCITESLETKSRCDNVIHLVSGIFCLFEIEAGAEDAEMGHFNSPEVSSTLLWFIKIWSDAYLLPSTEYYAEIGETLKQAFGTDTPGGIWTMNFILKQIYRYMKVSMEKLVVDDSIDLFVSLVKKKDKCSTVFTSEFFKPIVNLKDHRLPFEAKSGLIKGLVSISVCVTDRALQQQYLEEILLPIVNRYRAIMLAPNLNQIYQDENIRMDVVAILEEIKSALSGVTMQSANLVFTMFLEILMDLHKVLELYHNYIMVVNLVLQLLCEAAQNMSFYDEQYILNEPCLSVIRVYVKYNSNRICTEKTAEEDSLQDLMLLLQLMNHLLARQFLEDEGE